VSAGGSNSRKLIPGATGPPEFRSKYFLKARLKVIKRKRGSTDQIKSSVLSINAERFASA
jgi:hypothetical protein